MKNHSPLNFKFCPFCAQELTIRQTYEQPRQYCNKCNWIHYPHMAIAVGGIIQKKNQVLLVKRNIDPYQGYWQFPAGFVEYGEHIEDSLSREIKEETGLDLKSSQFFQLFQINDDPREPSHLFLAFKVKVSGQSSLSTDLNENSSISWHSLTKLPPIGWQSHQDILSQLT